MMSLLDIQRKFGSQVILVENTLLWLLELQRYTCETMVVAHWFLLSGTDRIVFTTDQWRFSRLVLLPLRYLSPNQSLL